MSHRVRRASRRYLLAPHLSEPSRLRRCPICQWVIDQDHAEASTMLEKQSARPYFQVELAPEQYEYVPLAVASSTLV